jgi:transcription termination/antitermination protein NusG
MERRTAEELSEAPGSFPAVTQTGGAMLHLADQIDTTLISANPAECCIDRSWFAIETRPRHEKRVAAGLKEKGIDAFLPLISAMHKWSDRRRMVQLPLFPGYVFVRIANGLNIRVSVLRTSGVQKFVGALKVGTPIPECQIAAIRTIVEQKIPFTLHPFLSIGRRVRLRGGSLDGIEGILLAKNGDQSLLVSVELIQRSVAMRVAGYQVDPI